MGVYREIDSHILPGRGMAGMTMGQDPAAVPGWW